MTDSYGCATAVDSLGLRPLIDSVVSDDLGGLNTGVCHITFIMGLQLDVTCEMIFVGADPTRILSRRNNWVWGLYVLFAII